LPIPNPESRIPALDHLRETWQTLGREDPLWAVLSHADKRGNRWRADEFLETGRAEIAAHMQVLDALGIPAERRLALDFGCGAGRLTRALAPQFDRAIGVDVSNSMIAAARALNNDIDNVSFVENASPQLATIADGCVDLVYSNMTLQHIPTELALDYIDEFYRVLAPGGVALFHFVAGTDESLRGRLYERMSNRWMNPLRRIAWRRSAVFEMHSLDENVMRERLAQFPMLELINATHDASAGPGWRGRRWYVVNRDEMPIGVAMDGYSIEARRSDVHIGAALIEGRGHDAHVAKALEAALSHGATFVDVGANIGIFTALGARLVGVEGRVIAIEPIARNRALIDRTIARNGFENVRVIAAAASDRAGEIELRTHPSTSNSATLPAAGERLRSEGGAAARVATIALDDALGDLDRVDVVKIDVEGMEPRVVRGMQRLIARFRPMLIVEFHPWAIERASGESADVFLDELAPYYAHIDVLHRDGTRESCADAAAVMRAWRAFNERIGLDGLAPLDIELRAE
jgi:FkbM family methyltransferase